ncbi:MAG: hypothetical protein LBM66_04205 [Bifidobacteriaceae bacterium]|jgi:alpha-tubulin suppressor-like RCC1 family protein|nr:hypothetical protein [Bifidobacteriaceae bacterium]
MAALISRCFRVSFARPVRLAAAVVAAAGLALPVLPAVAAPASREPAAATVLQTAKKKLKTHKPKVKGAARQGVTLKAKVAKWGPGKVKLTYRWLRNGKAIKHAARKSYKLTRADVGKRIQVKVTGKKAGYKTVSVKSKKTAKVKAGTGAASSSAGTPTAQGSAAATGSAASNGTSGTGPTPSPSPSPIMTPGTLWAWGDDGENNLGIYRDGIITEPEAVDGIADVKQVATDGVIGIALTGDGTVWTWGCNDQGEFGNGVESDPTNTDPAAGVTPTRVAGLTDIVDVGLGGLGVWAIDAAGTMWWWGQDVRSGPLSTSEYPAILTPTKVAGLPPVKYALVGGVAPGLAGSTILALAQDGTVWAWGNDAYGLLGDGGTTTTGTPAQVEGLSDITQLVTSDGWALALAGDGTVWSWGVGPNVDDVGDVCTTADDSNTVTCPLPTRVPGLTGITSLTLGGITAYALDGDGDLWSWGFGKQGQLGNGQAVDSTSPVKVTGLGSVTQVAADGDSALVIDSDGQVWTWGNNNHGQLGVGETSTAYRATPAKVAGVPAARSVVVSEDSAFVLGTDGTVWTWGYGHYGQLGTEYTPNSNPDDVLAPAQVPLISHVASLFVYGDAVFVLIGA